MELPKIGLGAWELRGGACTRVVRVALEIGYRHIDTAHVYENHQAIHQALQGFERSQIYLTSKIAIEEQVDPKSVEASVQRACEAALKELGTDYLDLYLIHSPNRAFPMEKIFMAMEKLVDAGKIRKVGVSNYTIHHLEDLRKAGFTPFANQVEVHPHLSQEEMHEYCRTHRIELIAYRPFGKGKLLSAEPLLGKIGAKHCKSAGQVVLRWLLQRGMAVIPKASSELHLRENLDVFDFLLTQEEMAQLSQLNKGKRYCRAEDKEFLY